MSKTSSCPAEQRGGHVERVVAGAGPDLEHPLAGRAARAISSSRAARDARVRRLAPRSAGCRGRRRGSCATRARRPACRAPRRPATRAQRGARRLEAGEADPVLGRTRASRRRPAPGRARRGRPRSRPRTSRLPSLDRPAQLLVARSSESRSAITWPPEKPTSTRRSSSSSRAISAAPSAGWTSSVSTPPVEAGCRNATRLSRMPRRGCSSIRRSPRARQCSSALATSAQR